MIYVILFQHFYLKVFEAKRESTAHIDTVTMDLLRIGLVYVIFNSTLIKDTSNSNDIQI